MKVTIKNLVAYYRVSTKRQGKSRLGLEAQEQAVKDFRRVQGGRLLATYVEIETGKRSDRPELAKAIAHARRSGALLVIAKIDRLSRNMAFTCALMDSGADFLACDNPHANRLTIHILAAIAEHEARMISQRTKDALASYKRRGGLLGGARPECRNLTDKARVKGRKAAIAAVKANADSAYSDLLPIMLEWKQAGLTQQAIADELNKQGHTTRRGKEWSQVQVMRVLQRA